MVLNRSVAMLTSQEDIHIGDLGVFNAVSSTTFS